MTSEIAPRLHHPKLEEVLLQLEQEPRVVMRLAIGSGSDPETSARAAWGREAAIDAPVVRFCNLLLLMAENAGATHLRLGHGAVEFRLGGAWHEAAQLSEAVRKRVVEQATWRLKQMSNLGSGQPEGMAAHGTVTLVFGPEGTVPTRRPVTFHTAFARTLGESILVLGVIEPRDRSDPRQTELDQMVSAAAERNGSGREKDGQRIYERALAFYELDPSCFPGGLVDIMNGLGLAHEGQWNLAKAEEYFRREVIAAAASYGEESVVLGFSLTNLGRFLLDRGGLDEAEKILARASAIFDSLFGADNAYLEVRRQRGRLHRARGHLEEARAEATHVLDRAERFESYPLIAESSLDLGVIEHTRGELEGAAAHFRRALELLGDDAAWHPFAVELDLGLARVLVDQGKDREAFTLLESARQIVGKLRGAEHPERVEVDVEIARHRERFGPYR